MTRGMDKDVGCVCVCMYVCMYVCIYIYIIEYYSALKKNEAMPFTATLEIVILNE